MFLFHVIPYLIDCLNLVPQNLNYVFYLFLTLLYFNILGSLTKIIIISIFSLILFNLGILSYESLTTI